MYYFARRFDTWLEGTGWSYFRQNPVCALTITGVFLGYLKKLSFLG